MGKPVIHFEIGSTNAKAAQEFYAKLFGWKIDATNPMNYGVIKTGAPGAIGGGIYQTDAAGTPGVTIYVAVDDTDAYLRKAEQLGGRVFKPTEVIPGMVTFALLADPAGGIMGLVKNEPMPKPAAKPTAKKARAKKKSPKRAKKKSAKRR